MPQIKMLGSTYHLEEGENLLEGLLKKGIRVPHSCRAGICHSCLLKLEKGQPPAGSQNKLSPKQIEQRCILACQSQVTDNLDVRLAQREQILATITALELINPTRLLVTLSPRFPLQETDTFNLIAIDAMAGLSTECPIRHWDSKKNILTIQIERKAGDAFSTWLYDSATVGQQVLLRLLD